MSRDKKEPIFPEVEVFSRNLIRAREAIGMNQRQLQLLTGITQPHLSSIERGTTNPSLKTMCRLARAVGQPLHVLLTP
jgi:transcriptional regulator with XRE-family HTH domain